MLSSDQGNFLLRGELRISPIVTDEDTEVQSGDFSLPNFVRLDLEPSRRAPFPSAPAWASPSPAGPVKRRSWAGPRPQRTEVGRSRWGPSVSRHCVRMVVVGPRLRTPGRSCPTAWFTPPCGAFRQAELEELAEKWTKAESNPERVGGNPENCWKGQNAGGPRWGPSCVPWEVMDGQFSKHQCLGLFDPVSVNLAVSGQTTQCQV